jgi:hydrogenase expression/formation protein HypE
MTPPPPEGWSLACPLPIDEGAVVRMAHGGGGRLTRDLLDGLVLPGLSPAGGGPPHDAAVLAVPAARLAFTTDSYVVHPLEFPGGDVASLAVHGTVNDLAMAGARPLWLSAAFIIEEGLPLELLRRLVASLRAAADACGVQVVTGDTKVVDRGKGDGIFINTAGIGAVEHDLAIGPAAVQPGDAILVSGDLGRHGMAVMAVREGLEFESQITSDSAPLAAPVLDLLAAGIRVHCLRDLTRGGLTAALNEIAAGCGHELRIAEAAIPVRDDVRAACEILGLDPLQVACEGRFALFVDPADAGAALAVLRRHPVAAAATAIGRCQSASRGPRVVLEGRLGPPRILDLPPGEQLPRIC